MSYDHLIVGAGFAGSVLAERLATRSGKRVLIIDKRPHIGGNAYDERDASGVLVHRYGPHIFHTNSQAIFDYLSGFTAWRPYEHRVLARVRQQLVPIPINRTTVNTLFDLALRDDTETARFFQQRAERRASITTSEDVVIDAAGRELYELFFRGYTRKQWGLDPSQLDASVAARIPTRTGTDDRYFTDTYQAMPRDGYTALFQRLLSHPRIDVRTGVSFEEIRAAVDYGSLIWTGPVDEFFDFRFGRLPYRSLRFEFQSLPGARIQPVGTINEPDESIPYTRTTEFGHLTGAWGDVTTLVREYPTADGDPYYPIPRPENAERYALYQALAANAPDVTFVGRLATYKYYNMDQVVGQALAVWKRMTSSASKAA